MASVLIVEDEFIVGKAVARALDRLGHEVLEVVKDRESALSAVEAACPDFVVLDVFLNGEHDGVEIAHAIRKICGSKILFVSGYPKTEIEQRTALAEPVAVLSKPYRVHELAEILERCQTSTEQEKGC